MATTTTNFGWDIPQSTDLVKDGATAIAALGQDIDTALVDLKGGTTGQILSKASGTDLDFSWVAAGAASPLTTKGDLYGFSTTNARIPVGANGTILTADSTAATGVSWATNSSVGKVLQVVFNSYSTAAVSSSSTFADTGLTATITPSSISSKILVIFSTNGVSKSAAASNLALSIRLVRGATTLQTPIGSGLYTNSALELRGTSVSGTHLDSPATTSATTYKTTFASGNNNSQVRVQEDNCTSSITLIEIGA